MPGGGIMLVGGGGIMPFDGGTMLVGGGTIPLGGGGGGGTSDCAGRASNIIPHTGHLTKLSCWLYSTSNVHPQFKHLTCIVTISFYYLSFTTIVSQA